MVEKFKKFGIIFRTAYKAWMKLALILGWINTRILLCAIFYLIFTPIGIAMKLFGADPLDRRIDKNADSYWRRKEIDPASYDRQF